MIEVNVIYIVGVLIGGLFMGGTIGVIAYKFFRDMGEEMRQKEKSDQLDEG